VTGTPIDAIAVGHYFGVKPQAAELALDRAISRALPGEVAGNGDKVAAEADLVLTQYTERGIIRGELGQLFFLPDPRREQGKGGAAIERVIAIAGMGMPGRFGAPELTVLTRELCWSPGRMGKKHLATVLIGAGNGLSLTTDGVLSGTPSKGDKVTFKVQVTDSSHATGEKEFELTIT
jgi:putative Ig domain-containing protein